MSVFYLVETAAPGRRIDAAALFNEPLREEEERFIRSGRAPTGRKAGRPEFKFICRRLPFLRSTRSSHG